MTLNWYNKLLEIHSQVHGYCIECKTTDGPLYTCKKCFSPVYCSESCQSKHFHKTHSKLCIIGVREKRKGTSKSTTALKKSRTDEVALEIIPHVFMMVPTDILRHITRFLSAEDVSNFRLVSKLISKIITTPPIRISNVIFDATKFTRKIEEMGYNSVIFTESVRKLHYMPYYELDDDKEKEYESWRIQIIQISNLFPNVIDVELEEWYAGHPTGIFPKLKRLTDAYHSGTVMDEHLLSTKIISENWPELEYIYTDRSVNIDTNYTCPRVHFISLDPEVKNANYIQWWLDFQVSFPNLSSLDIKTIWVVRSIERDTFTLHNLEHLKIRDLDESVDPDHPRNDLPVDLSVLPINLKTLVLEANQLILYNIESLLSMISLRKVTLIYQGNEQIEPLLNLYKILRQMPWLDSIQITKVHVKHIEGTSFTAYVDSTSWDLFPIYTSFDAFVAEYERIFDMLEPIFDVPEELPPMLPPLDDPEFEFYY